jgi:hypothetical protein
MTEVKYERSYKSQLFWNQMLDSYILTTFYPERNYTVSIKLQTRKQKLKLRITQLLFARGYFQTCIAYSFVYEFGDKPELF